MVHYAAPAAPTGFNLALEQVVLRRAPESAFWLWRGAPAVVLGRHQDASAEVDLAEAAHRGVPVLRRRTGGGAVCHDRGVLCFSFVLPAAEPERVRGEIEESLAIPADEASFRIRYPWDLLKINEEYLAGYTENVINGTVRERVTLDGVVILGEGSVLLPGVYIEGVAVIGKNCKIGPNCYLRGYNFISDKCHIGQAVEIKNSILMTHVAAGHLSYIGDSIVCQNVNFGAGTITSNFRHDGKNHRSMVQGSLIDTGRRKFGSIIGENVHTGIHTAIYPGRKLWADVQTRPGDVVQLDLMK